ncbi:hypothetical protein K493DRAFT_311060 [Basidiobolus meristosporus CBS 931.73]|uniref:Uncharacterized protein n=1 Tax=Basidiobolus meristosporus CBS 931.73 TaxID=1314790 RepID=A0A1Y1Z4P2_9FUNG|nr:hypothetical protein K493DRAFT_311060 [Basidiobolus meristosporus CBS 931.73]|eukprot:ORY05231.1 hypothetical protein K493DRAFT_311060 [Basidiobolus meristosporus CBS 931.73]
MAHSKERKASLQGLEGQLDWLQAQLQANATPKIKTNPKPAGRKVAARGDQRSKEVYSEPEKRLHPLLELELEESGRPFPQADRGQGYLSEYNDTQVLLAKVNAALGDNELELNAPEEREVDALLKKVDEVLREPFTMVGTLPLAQPKFHHGQQQQETSSKKATSRNLPLPAHTKKSPIDHHDVKQLAQAHRKHVHQKIPILPTPDPRLPTQEHNQPRKPKPQLPSEETNQRQPVFTYADQQRLRRLREMRYRQ